MEDQSSIFKTCDELVELDRNVLALEEFRIFMSIISSIWLT